MSSCGFYTTSRFCCGRCLLWAGIFCYRVPQAVWTGALLSSGLHGDLHVLPSLTDSFLGQHGFVYDGWSFFIPISEGRGGSAGAGARPGLLAFPRHLNSGSRDTPGVRSLCIPFL